MRLFLLLLFSGAAFAAPPSLTVVPSAPKSGDAVTVTASVGAAFDVRGASGVLPHPNKKSVVFIVPDSGSVLVVVTAGKVATPQDVAVLMLGAGAIPGPGPVPVPVPDPIVTPTKLGIYYIEESSDNVAGRGALFANAELAARVKAKGHRWRVADLQVTGPDGKPPMDLVRYLTLTNGKPVPQVFLVDESGTIRFQGDAPVKASDLLALITKFGG